MARPTKEIKRTECVTVRFTKAEFRLVQKYAERSGLRLAEFIHDRALGYKIAPRLTEDEIKLYLQLVGMANNLNQLAKQANQRELLVLEILKTLEHINKAVEKLQ